MASHDRMLLALVAICACTLTISKSERSLVGQGRRSSIKREVGPPGDQLLREWSTVKKRETRGIVESVDGNPEFEVRVKGQNEPLCFQLQGQPQQVFRLVQDPVTGIIVNARVFVDQLTDRTYLGAIVISKGSFRVLAKQRVVIVNKTRFNWNQVNTTTFQGHRVMVGQDRVMVNFRRHHVILEIRRSFLKQPRYLVGDIDHHNFTTLEPGQIDFSDPTDPNGDADQLTDPDSDEYPYEDGMKPEIRPAIQFQEADDAMRNSAASSSRWSGLFSWGGWSKPPDQESNIESEIDIDDDSNRNEAQFDRHSWGETKPAEVSRRSHDIDDSSFSAGSHMSDHVIQNEQLVKQLHKQMESSTSSRHNVKRWKKFPRGGRYKNMAASHRTTIFLGFYILEGSGFSNRTHGLLGQFLYKSVTTLKLNWGSSSVLQAIFQVNGNPDRTAAAIYTQREHAGQNSTRPCWLLSHGGLNVIDGGFPDYLVPHIRYNGLRELPPPAPL